MPGQGLLQNAYPGNRPEGVAPDLLIYIIRIYN